MCIRDRFNSGRIDFSRVDREKFSNEINLLLLNNKIVSLGRYIEIIHDLYESCFRGGVRKIIFLKEGNQALTTYNRIVSHFSNVKFIVLSRNPKDCFTSRKLSELSESLTFSGSSLLEFLFANKKSSFIQFTKFQLLNLENNKIFFIRYEDLVLNLEKSMENICEFLNIDYSDSLLMPTTAGAHWGGNSSSNLAQHVVTSDSINNYLKHLTDNEVTFIDYYLSKYQALNKYNFILTANKLHLLAKLSPHMFPKISLDYKDFVRPYLRIIRWLKNCIVLSYMAMVKKRL